MWQFLQIYLFHFFYSYSYGRKYTLTSPPFPQLNAESLTFSQTRFISSGLIPFFSLKAKIINSHYVDSPKVIVIHTVAIHPLVRCLKTMDISVAIHEPLPSSHYSPIHSLTTYSFLYNSESMHRLSIYPPCAHSFLSPLKGGFQPVAPIHSFSLLPVHSASLALLILRSSVYRWLTPLTSIQSLSCDTVFSSNHSFILCSFWLLAFTLFTCSLS